MKRDNLFEEFENLLMNKEFRQLDDNERDLVNQFIGSSSEYNAMRLLMLESHFMTEESRKCRAPVGGADKVWSRFEAQKKSSPRTALFNRKVSVSWVTALAAALIISWIIRFPYFREGADAVVLQVNKPVLVSAVTSDTIIKEVPVYIQCEPETAVEKSSVSAPSGGMVYMQPVQSVSDPKNQRQGTNANELGDLAKLTVTLD